MQPIGRHISNLLFDHDCVILPALGGFLASNESARMLPNRVVYPPYRRLAFNVYLKQNDGLLANHLVETENITYAAANTLLEEFTYECIQHLEQGEKVSIDQIGTLYFDREKNIQFEAFRNINHRKDSFGLEPVQLITVEHSAEEIRKPVVKPAKPKVKVNRPSEEPKRPFISTKAKRVIGVAVVLATFAWFGTNIYFSSPKNYEATSVIPFDSQASVISIEPTRDSSPVIINDTESSQTTSTDSQPAEDTQSLAINVPPAVETKPIVVETPPAVIKPVTPPVSEPSVSMGPKRYMVAGVFKIKENAMTKQSQLLTAGFNNAQIIESNGLNYVTYSTVNSTEEALALSDSLRKINLEGWIWKH